MDNDPNKWNVYDPFPDLSIDEIRPISQRAAAYFVRNREDLNDYYVELFGAINMLKGLDYHFDNTLSYFHQLTPFDDFRKLIEEDRQQEAFAASQRNSRYSGLSNHEIAAYLNRLYQFQNFSTSDLVRPISSRLKKSGIKHALKFRHNLTGKRMIDRPNLDEYHKMQARYSEMGNLYDRHGHLQLQITVNKETINFCLIESHEEIMLESYEIIRGAVDTLPTGSQH